MLYWMGMRDGAGERGEGRVESIACFTGHRPSRRMRFDPGSPQGAALRDRVHQAVRLLCLERGVRVFLCGMAAGFDLFAARCMLEPVSYTHLDVYKRQVLAHAFYHRYSAGIADAEALSRHTGNVSLAAGGAVEGHISDDNVFLRHEPGLIRRIDGQLSAGEALAEVVVAVAAQGQGETCLLYTSRCV